MPTLSCHIPKDSAETVTRAIKASGKKNGPWLWETVCHRLEREGLMPGDSMAAVIEAVNQIGPEKALAALTRAARRKSAA